MKKLGLYLKLSVLFICAACATNPHQNNAASEISTDKVVKKNRSHCRDVEKCVQELI